MQKTKSPKPLAERPNRSRVTMRAMRIDMPGGGYVTGLVGEITIEPAATPTRVARSSRTQRERAE